MALAGATWREVALMQTWLGSHIEQAANIAVGFTVGATLAVILFMIVTYGRFGVYATAALIVNALMILGVMAVFNATLTLPGIAGFVLTVGAAVDAAAIVGPWLDGVIFPMCESPEQIIVPARSAVIFAVEPEHLREMIRAVRGAVSIPLTIKIRAGWDANSRNALEIGQIAFHVDREDLPAAIARRAGSPEPKAGP